MSSKNSVFRSSNTSTVYPGNELTLFAKARTWKDYWTSKVAPFIRGDVLDVGSGIGGNADYLIKNSECIKSLTMLEPDPSLHQMINTEYLLKRGLDVACFNLTVEEMIEERYSPGIKGCGGLFDTVIYADVLEHIENDVYELSQAALILKAGGYLVVLAPAHNWIRSRFDDSVGHFRRYDHNMLSRLATREIHLEEVFYLDSAGLALSMLNKCILRQAYPSIKQIMVWDRVVVRISTVLDRLLKYRLGKSVVGIYRKW